MKLLLEIELNDKMPGGVNPENLRRAIFGLRSVRSVVEVEVAVTGPGDHYARTYDLTWREDTRLGPR